jgi:hypothetical protein
MKLSNKILIGFLAVLFLYLNAAFIEIRLRGTNTSFDEDNSIAETVNINGVTSLVLEDLQRTIRIFPSDTSRLEVRSTSGNLMKQLSYSITGETLTLKSIDVNENVPVNISLYVPESSLKTLSVKGAEVRVKGLKLDVFEINQNEGWITLEGRGDIGLLNLKSTNGYISISDTKLDTLVTNLDNTELILSAPLKLLKGSASNNSSAHFTEVEVLEFRKDKSSRLYLDSYILRTPDTQELQQDESGKPPVE